MIQLSEFGEIDDDITFDFNPLRQMKPIEQAQLQTTTAQTRELYVQIGAVDAAEVRKTLAQDPDSPFGGLDLTKPLEAPPGMGGMPASRWRRDAARRRPRRHTADAGSDKPQPRRSHQSRICQGPRPPMKTTAPPTSRSLTAATLWS